MLETPDVELVTLLVGDIVNGENTHVQQEIHIRVNIVIGFRGSCLHIQIDIVLNIAEVVKDGKIGTQIIVAFVRYE
jgi:hypothetical protein